MKYLGLLFIGWVAGAATLIALIVPELWDEQRNPMGGTRR